MITLPDILVNFDGSVGPSNPGEFACFAFTVSDSKNTYVENGICDSEYKTNNVAEYTAVIKALEYCIEHHKDKKIIVRGDSNLIIKQIKGLFKCKKPHLQELLDKAIALSKELDVEFKWIPREENKLADKYSKYQNIM
jgi:ribonuclease HI